MKFSIPRSRHLLLLVFLFMYVLKSKVYVVANQSFLVSSFSSNFVIKQGRRHPNIILVTRILVNLEVLHIV